MAYYDGTKLLSLMDINGNKPEIYICTTNRTGGKTTYFGRMLTNRFIKTREKFGLIYRYDYEIENCAEKFFKDIQGLFFPTFNMTSKVKGKGAYHELFLNDVPCGYAFSLNSAEKIKKMSHLLSDTQSLLFDEFQSETNNYCPNEIRKLLSVHTSLARGQGKQVRYLPLYMLGNNVSLLNPYYVELGISDRLRNDTNFLRGDGFVLEQGFIESASNAQKDSAFNRAFSKNNYVAFGSQNIYLNDNATFIENLNGRSKYICTIKCSNKFYGIKEYADQGVVYCDNKPDMTHPIKISVTTDDHQINFVMLRNNLGLISLLRYYFDNGCFRFKNLECKQAMLKLLSY